MKSTFILLLTCFSLLVVPTTVTAQDLQEDTNITSQDNSETSQSISAPPPSDKAKNIFSQASNNQIQEAQQFYRRCSANDVMNKTRDCRCAATAYLEIRVKLGDIATVDQIMDNMTNACLIEEEKNSSKKPDIDTSKINPKYLDEAEKIYQTCKKDGVQSTRRDCECLAAKFLDERIERGPMVNQDVIFISLRGECKNMVEHTGYEYQQCMINPIGVPFVTVVKKDFCECYARKWAQLYDAYDGEVHVAALQNLKRRARMGCLNIQ